MILVFYIEGIMIMTKLLLIRHGEPTYEEVIKRKYRGQGLELGPLSSVGIEQAKKVSKDKRLKGAQIIISSPYTRAMQTAAIISRELDLDIVVENDIHEWIPDLTFSNQTMEESYKATRELTKYKGEHPQDMHCNWEPISAVANRAISCLKKYLDYEKIIVVCHGVVIRQFQFKYNIDYCEVTEVDFDENFEWKGWSSDLVKKAYFGKFENEDLILDVFNNHYKDKDIDDAKIRFFNENEKEYLMVGMGIRDDEKYQPRIRIKLKKDSSIMNIELLYEENQWIGTKTIDEIKTDIVLKKV